MIRQGDVLLIPVTEKSTGDFDEVPRNQGRVVLAYGEATGHPHPISYHDVHLFQHKKEKDKRFLRVGNVCFLKHEEHSEHKIPAGDYLVIQQREYSPEEIRSVTD